MVVTKCKILEINLIIVFKEHIFKEYSTYFQPTITLRYPGSLLSLTDNWVVLRMKNERISKIMITTITLNVAVDKA